MYIEDTGRRIADNSASTCDPWKVTINNAYFICIFIFLGPLVEHFNLPSHNCISDLSVSVILAMRGDTRKRIDEIGLIFAQPFYRGCEWG